MSNYSTHIFDRQQWITRAGYFLDCLLRDFLRYFLFAGFLRDFLLDGFLRDFLLDGLLRDFLLDFLRGFFRLPLF